jgi:hypothetical protein
MSTARYETSDLRADTEADTDADTEDALKARCEQCALSYRPPATDGETGLERRRRQMSLKQACARTEAAGPIEREIERELEMRCERSGYPYTAPDEDETAELRCSRRRALLQMCKWKEKAAARDLMRHGAFGMTLAPTLPDLEATGSTAAAAIPTVIEVELASSSDADSEHDGAPDVIGTG